MARTIHALVERARGVHRDAVLGSLSDVGPVLRVLEATTHPLSRAWAAALRSELWLTEPRYGVRPPASWLSDFVDGPAQAREGAIVALANGARIAMLDFDSDALSELEAIARPLAEGLSEEPMLSAEIVIAWAALGRGDVARAHEHADELVHRASKAGLAASVVEAQALRALAAIGVGDLDSALDLARRASLVARTEGLPKFEFFAHLGLARARRYARQPHLALRILEALGSVVTRAFRPWLAWESLFSGGGTALADVSLAPDSKARRAAQRLFHLLEAARAGDRVRFESELATLVDDTRRFAPAFGETLDVCGAIDPKSKQSSPELERFRRGETVLTPASVHGLRVRANEDDESAGAYVLAVPPQAGVRLLHWGVALVEGPGTQRIRQSRRAQGRVETLIAILALAGDQGLDEKNCFSQAYGFELIPEVHRGVFDVLLQRARSAIEGFGELERADGRVALHLDSPLVVPDPRVSQRTTDRVLHLLAEKGAASAKDAAGLLGISLRSAQVALAELATNGVCDTRNDGRNVAYVVEDTVFSEPSRRLVASDLTGLTRLEA